MKNQFVSPLAAIAALTMIACAASNPTTELRTAREAYQKAQHNETAELNPADLRVAQRALQRAEQIHEDKPGSEQEANAAYVAFRKVEFANAKAAAKKAETERERAQETYERELEQAAEAKREYASNLKEARQQLIRVRSEMQQMQEQDQELSATLKQKEKELAEQVAKLEASEKRASEARRLLEEMAKVQETQDRLQITLSGSVLFKTNSDELLPIAQDRLNTVADALEGYEGREIVIEGHTDSRGTEQHNQQLSQKRAEAVKEYLASRGIAASQIKAVGKGEVQPVAQNDSPEGRANNRRVEIIVQEGAKQKVSASVQE